MLIPEILSKHNIPVKGIIHIGAHQCEESVIYQEHGVEDEKIIWIEGNPDLVKQAQLTNPTFRIFQGLISDREGETNFIVTNNYESSSILELATHKIEHPHIHEIERKKIETTTLLKLFEKHNLNSESYNFLSMDIQGAELLALKGMGEILNTIEHIYTEVNERELYKDCALFPEITSFLAKHGFKLIEVEMTQFGWGDAYYAKPTESLNLVEDKLTTSQINVFNNDNPVTNGEQAFFKAIQNQCKTVFDVGSRWDSLFANLPSLHVHYFEPVKEYLDKLQSIESNPNAVFNNFGLGERSEIVTYYHQFQSFINREDTVPWAVFGPKEQLLLQVFPGSEYLDREKLGTIDFLKIDTEGYEINVLRGLKPRFRDLKIVQFEYGGTFLDAGVTLREVVDLLQADFLCISYLYELDNKPVLVEISDTTDHYKYCNIVCFNKRFYSSREDLSEFLDQQRIGYNWSDLVHPAKSNNVGITNNQPDLYDLRRLISRYQNFYVANNFNLQPTTWDTNTTYITSSIDETDFRNDNAYVWQTRLGDGHAEHTAYFERLRSHDHLGLFKKTFEDGSFGCNTWTVDNIVISRDLLDSILELYFLQGIFKNLDNLNILEIGAGYGRLCKRYRDCFPNVNYYATDGIPHSTYLSNLYLSQFDYQDSVWPLHTLIESLESYDIDLAICIHSFPEQNINDTEWWIKLLSKNNVRNVFYVPNDPDTKPDLSVEGTGDAIQKVFRRNGFRVKYFENMYQAWNIDYTYAVPFLLFENSNILA